MTIPHYENIKTGILADYISADKFRTILPKERELPTGVSEIPVEIELKKESKKLLSFPVPWDGELYGCLRDKKELQKKLGLDCKVISATIADWDDKFVVVFEAEDDQKSVAFYIRRDEVIALLENCRRVPEQIVSANNERK